jgi:hypothetical protein
MKTQLALFVSLLLPLTSACIIVQDPPRHRNPTPPPPAGQTGANTPPPASPPPASPPPASANVTGAWVSPACGARTYPRKIQFDGKGGFESQDLVSPCPPKVTCIWSGIVLNKGTYAVEQGSIRLTNPQPGTGPKAQALPNALGIDAATAAPVEGADGAKCVYTRDGLAGR